MDRSINDILPEDVESLSIGFDVLCDKTTKYRHLMSKQLITENQSFCGFQAFPYKDLKDDKSIKWKFAVKIYDIQFKADNNDIDGVDENSFNQTLQFIRSDAQEASSYNKLVQLCQSLFQQNQGLLQQIKDAESKIAVPSGETSSNEMMDLLKSLNACNKFFILDLECLYKQHKERC